MYCIGVRTGAAKGFLSGLHRMHPDAVSGQRVWGLRYLLGFRVHAPVFRLWGCLARQGYWLAGTFEARDIPPCPERSFDPGTQRFVLLNTLYI